MVVDLYLVYAFIKRLTTPFTEWDAYRLGIIDDKGNVIKKRKDLRTFEEKNAFGVFDLMVLNIKKTMAKVPGGETKLASYAAALYLIKEWNCFSDENTLNESLSDEAIETHIKRNLVTYLEDTAVGNGGIAGLGVGPQGEPGFTKDHMRKHRKRTTKEVT